MVEYMLMKENLRQTHTLRICLILILSFSIFPEFVFSYKDTCNKVGIGSASPEETSTCDEHNCPILPDEPFHHCAVCCALSHSFINPLTGIVFHFKDTPQPSSITEDVFYKELFAKTIFHPPQSIL
jgi:hypothetical protein